MKKFLAAIFLSILFVTSYAQDSIGFVYLNKYREFYNLPSLTKETFFKDVCVKWCYDASEINFEHTNLENVMAEVITYGDLSENSTDFYKFVKNVAKKDLNDLESHERVVLLALYHWEKSTSHKKCLTDKSYKTAYFSISVKNKVFYAITQMK